MNVLPQTLEEKIEYVKEHWFLMEPIYFMTICTHKVVIHPEEERYAIRCGAMKLEFGGKRLADISVGKLDELMRVEIVRILLKHPYQRIQPNLVKNLIASNLVVASNMKFEYIKANKASEVFGDESCDKQSLEYIYDRIELPEDEQEGEGEGEGEGQGQGNGSNGQGGGKSQQQGKGNGNGNKKNNRGNGGGNGKGNSPYDDLCNDMGSGMAQTETWSEDDYAVAEIDNIIEKADSSNGWGNLPGELVEQIKASLIPKFNYKSVFKRFRGNLLSSKRCLTRMKPNRRFGFTTMGSKREFTTKLLVAIDTSGSVGSDDLANALGFINGFFKYGIEEIDVINWDVRCYDDSLINIKKRKPTIEVTGRGGTNWNDVFRYMSEHRDYNGVIIFTDGYADKPDHPWLSLHPNRVLWCMTNKNDYEAFMKNFGNMDTVVHVSYIEANRRKKN